MTEYNQQYAAPAGAPPAPRSPLRLAAELLLDMTILVAAVLITALGLAFVIIGVRMAQQGLSLAELGGLSRADQLRLIGTGGVFLLLLVQNAVFVAVPLVRTRLLRREPLATIGVQAQRPLRLLLIGVGLGALLLAANLAISLLFASLGIRQNQSAQYPLYQGDYAGQALFMLGAAVVVPIGEELLFRGYVLNTLLRIGDRARWGVPAAYLLSAALFGFAHILAATEGVVALIAPTIVMGLVLAWAAHRTGSILPGIVAHGANNGLALLALLACINNPGICPAA